MGSRWGQWRRHAYNPSVQSVQSMQSAQFARYGAAAGRNRDDRAFSVVGAADTGAPGQSAGSPHRPADVARFESMCFRAASSLQLSSDLCIRPACASTARSLGTASRYEHILLPFDKLCTVSLHL